MNCKKCAGRTTRRRAGQFFCQRCGMQPGDTNMDRAGFPQPTYEIQGPPSGPAYITSTTPSRKLRGVTNQERTP